MNITAEQSFTQVRPQKWPGKLVQFPLTRIFISLVFLAPVVFAYQMLGQGVFDNLEGDSAWLIKSVAAVIGTILLLLSYVAYCRVVERRRAWELSLGSAAGEFGLGGLIGAGLCCVVVLILLLAGSIHITDFSFDGTEFVRQLLVLNFAAAFEEMLFRLIIFRITEEALGSRFAVALQAVLFGLAHIGNPNATLWSSTAIAVEAGLLLAAGYMLTRRLWLVLGLHLFWNFFQSSIFGIPTSGTEAHGVMTSNLTGPEWLSGGAFGIEASVVAVVICLTVAVILFRMASHKGAFILPFWKRQHPPVPDNSQPGDTGPIVA